jgi:hypothetical protein
MPRGWYGKNLGRLREGVMWAFQRLAIIAGLIAAVSGCANAVNKENAALEKFKKNIRSAEAACVAKKFPLISQRISCQYAEGYPYVQEYSEYLIPYYTNWRDQHLVAAYKLEEETRRPEIKKYKETLDAARSEMNSTLKAVEPQYYVFNSKLDAAMRKALADAHCGSPKVFIENACMQSAITPVWAQLSPNTLDVLSE